MWTKRHWIEEQETREITKKVQELAKDYKQSEATIINLYGKHSNMEGVQRELEHMKHEKEVKEAQRKAKEALNHKLYKDALEYFTDTQREQIIKGFNKYGTPLDPDEWTLEELTNHLIQELVDAVHYTQALKTKAPANETPQIELLYNDINILRKDRDAWRERAEHLEKKLDSVKDLVIE